MKPCCPECGKELYTYYYSCTHRDEVEFCENCGYSKNINDIEFVKQHLAPDIFAKRYGKKDAETNPKK
jgi:hypothetical protein